MNDKIMFASIKFLLDTSKIKNFITQEDMEIVSDTEEHVWELVNRYIALGVENSIMRTVLMNIAKEISESIPPLPPSTDFPSQEEFQTFLRTHPYHGRSRENVCVDILVNIEEKLLGDAYYNSMALEN